MARFPHCEHKSKVKLTSKLPQWMHQGALSMSCTQASAYLGQAHFHNKSGAWGERATHIAEVQEEKPPFALGEGVHSPGEADSSEDQIASW